MIVRFSEAVPMEGDRQLPLDEYEVHPVADLFPMLADDELAELAADIKARGQLQPIVLDTEGRILDGRNRLAACRLAGVEPKFDYYTDDDPDGYALAVNVARRHITKGQISMVVSMSAKIADPKTGVDISPRYREMANAVSAYEDLAGRVIDGTMPLDKAHDEAQRRNRTKEAARASKIRLRDAAPDLLALVEDERMSLDDAIGALEVRERKAKESEALAVRVAKLPADLADRVNAESLSIDEAESVVQQRYDRLVTWSDKVRLCLETLRRMAGNPIPSDLKAHLKPEEADELSAVLGALEAQEARHG